MSDLEKCISEIEFRFPCVRDHEFTSKEWQTLKTAVLAQLANNIARDEICPVTAMSCPYAKIQVICKLDGPCHHKEQGKLSPVA